MKAHDFKPIADGGPAFPTAITQAGGTGVVLGMTLLDYYAGQAMQGICANAAHWGDETIASDAFDIAEDMLDERNRRLDLIARSQKAAELAKRMDAKEYYVDSWIDLTNPGRRPGDDSKTTT